MAPVREMPVRFSVALPLLVRVTVWGTEGDPTSCEAKVREEGDNEIVGVVAVPLPVRVIVFGEDVAFETIVMAAVRVPAAAGSKVTVKAQ